MSRNNRTFAKNTKIAATVLISTYERPEQLRRALLSVKLQQGAAGRFEVVVTDDGSQDETGDLVAKFAEDVDFPVHFTTHEHNGFQLSRCRNEGVQATTAPYLLFMDGDLVLPPDFVAQHLTRRLAGIAMAGESCYLPKDISENVDEQAICNHRFMDWIPPSETKRMKKKAFHAWIYNLLRMRTLPRFKGGNIGMWREDYERVNGYDQNFVGWGLEETDLQIRLAKHGVRFRSSLGWTTNCHLWHPPSPSFVPKAQGTDNESYMNQPGRLSKCRHGLQTRAFEEISIQVSGRSETPAAQNLLLGRFTSSQKPVEVELLFAEKNSRFTAQAECNVLILDDPSLATQKLIRQAHILVSDTPISGSDGVRQFPRHRFEEALDSIV